MNVNALMTDSLQQQQKGGESKLQLIPGVWEVF